MPENTPFEHELHDSSQAVESEALETSQSESVLGRARRVYDRYQDWAEENPVKATVAETVALYGLRKVIESGARKAGVPTGNAFRESHIQAAAAHPIKGVVQAIVKAPIAEEIAFRGVLDAPARRLDKNANHVGARAYRAATAAVFAMGHAGVIMPHEDWPKPPFATIKSENATIPIGQLIGGLNYQRLGKKRGFVHSIIGHMTTNTLAVAEAAPQLITERKKEPSG